MPAGPLKVASPLLLSGATPIVIVNHPYVHTTAHHGGVAANAFFVFMLALLATGVWVLLRGRRRSDPSDVPTPGQRETFSPATGA
jgi:hypothetical protein